jgi:hypothetical protein
MQWHGLGMSRYQVIGIDSAERRRNRRSALPQIEIEIEGEVYVTTNWSLGGFMIEPYSGKRKTGDHLTVTIVVKVNDKEFRHRTDATVARRRRAAGQLAAHFQSIPPEAIDTLDGLITGRLRRLGR